MALTDLRNDKADIFHICMIVIDMTWQTTRTAKSTMLHSIDGYAARGQYIPHIDVPATVSAQPVQYKKDLGASGLPAAQEELACIFCDQFLACSYNPCCRLHLAPIPWCIGSVIHGSLLVVFLNGAVKSMSYIQQYIIQRALES